MEWARRGFRSVEGTAHLSKPIGSRVQLSAGEVGQRWGEAVWRLLPQWEAQVQSLVGEL